MRVVGTNVSTVCLLYFSGKKQKIKTSYYELRYKNCSSLFSVFCFSVFASSPLAHYNKTPVRGVSSSVEHTQPPHTQSPPERNFCLVSGRETRNTAVVRVYYLFTRSPTLKWPEVGAPLLLLVRRTCLKQHEPPADRVSRSGGRS